MNKLKKNPIMLVGIVLILVSVPYLAPHDPLAIDPSNRLLPLSYEHVLGTDHLGRDVLSRILHGGQATVGVSFFIMILVLSIGVPIGIIAGGIGGVVDRVFMRITDAFMTFPDFMVAIVLSGLLGPGMLNLMMAIIVVKWTSYARLVRSTVIEEKEKNYILVAELNGVPPFAILLKHLLPHVIGNVVVLATLDIGKVMLMIASLSYIGLGTQPPSPEWGAMLNEGRAYFQLAPQLMLAPGLAIVLVVLATNLLGDRLRDHYDVKTGGS
ncbi:ABC transporter permease subunit [Bacillus hwajinpoensis]|uniref:ABC transporter permease subunit n=1 Tax=Guptibacillus hwajinpoensis TaxID=208199 RepID=A0A845F0M6_9BACL|nr:nickel transporter permease [Pseudalkalibacillus hwajinpoensis]MYL64403.1 ABC transporter permease subunit [Pseudalkalibacillus hwajinpoensis]